MATESEQSRKPGGEEDQDEEIDEQQYMTAKDAVLFAIDISDSMLQKQEPSDPKKGDGDCAAIAALKCAYQLMQQRIISNPNDKMGILLYGTEQSKFEEEEDNRSGVQYPHCYLLMDLNKPGAEDIKQVRSIVDDEEQANQLLEPSSEPAAMSNLLFCANQVFTTRAQNFTSRRLFLVTDNDNPHSDNKDLRSAAVVRAKDLYDLGVTIELFPISQQGKDFNTAKFYDDVIYRPPSDPDAPAPVSRSVAKTSQNDGISLLQSLLSSIYAKVVPKRAIFSNLPLEFSSDFKISVKGYIIFKRQEPKRSCYVYLDGEKALLAEHKTTRYAGNSGHALNEKSEMRKAYKFGGDNVLFTNDELANITHFGDPVIRIIGFKPLDMLPPWARMKHSTFIYPSEELFVGSTRTFAALHRTLLTQNKMGLVWFIPRRNSAPCIAAMIPGAEKTGKSGEQLLPAGLWLHTLPFVDDIRNNPEIHGVIRAPDVLKDKMRDVVLQLQLPGAQYDPAKYPNPSLQWHYTVLRAMALDEDMPDKPDDKTIPRYRQIHKRAGEFVIDWGNTLQDEFDRFRRENSHVVKRELTATTASAPKKSKPSEDLPTMNDAQMQAIYDSQTISKLTVAQLKSYLNSKNIKYGSAKKKELVEFVEDHMGNTMR